MDQESAVPDGLLLRGRVLSFKARPNGIEDTSAYLYEEDGGVLVRNGKIAAVGSFSSMLGDQKDIAVIDHRPCLILPGFVDAHAHMPQMQVVASYGTELLEWLNKYTFPEETKFANPGHARRLARLFLEELLRHGTTTVAAYCTVHRTSAEAFFTEAQALGMLVVGGKVMMDRNAPDALTDTPQSSFDDSKALIGEWHGKGRLYYAITPRFAITSTPEQLEMAQALAQEHPYLHVQTHLSENHAEIALTQKLYPEARDYADVYARYGLLGPKTILGHCIHLSDREADLLSDTGSVAVFCPTSNLFLGSGLFDWRRYTSRPRPLRIATATDIAGGTSYSMLVTMDEAYKVVALQGDKLDPLSSFWQITLGNAKALSLDDKIGTLDVGSDADIVVLDARATGAMSLRMETVNTLQEELFVLQTLGDDRAVRQVYVAGKGQKAEARL
jgi:guanine deaminase